MENQCESDWECLIQLFPKPSALVDLNGRIVMVNADTATLLGYEDEDFFCGQPIFTFIESIEQQRAFYNFKQTLFYNRTKKSEYRLLHRNGAHLPVEAHTALVLDKKGFPQGFITTFDDLRESKSREEKLKRLSYRDALTGLYNRTFFQIQLRSWADASKNPVCLVVCDINGLKLANDTLGHVAGDRLLTHVAWLLQSCFQENDLVARIGGDEFAIICPNTDFFEAEKIKQKIKTACQEYNVADPEFPVCISVGFAVGKAVNFEDMQALLTQADYCMYQDKINAKYMNGATWLDKLLSSLVVRGLITEGQKEKIEKSML